MKKEEIEKATFSITSICRKFNGKKVNAINFVLFLLLWAKFIPKTKNNIIGFFDILESVDSLIKFQIIYEELERELSIDFDSLFIKKDKIDIQQIDGQRTQLLPVAKILAKGSIEDIYQVIRYLQNYKDRNDPNSSYSGAGTINSSVLLFAKKIFEDSAGKDNLLNSLYPSGTASASFFANTRNVYIDEENDFERNFTKGLFALYGEPNKLKEDFQQTDITFAAPPLGLRARDNWTFSLEEDEDSKLIRDIHCKSIYLAHKHTKKTTVAITTANTLFSGTTGINYFRKKIIDNNWLESIVVFPRNMFSRTMIPLVMLVLKKDRDKNNKVRFINFSECQIDDLFGMFISIPSKEISNLFDIYKGKKKSNISESVNIEKIKSNDYDLNLKKYLFSTEDRKIINILQKREVVSLSSIVEIIRPLSYAKPKKGVYVHEITISDINEIGEIVLTDKKVLVSETYLAKSNVPLVKEGDLLLSIKGTLGKVGMVSTKLKNTIPGTSFCILRPYESTLVKSDYLFLYLRSFMGQRMIQISSQGGMIPFISINDLKNLAIPIPSKDEEKKGLMLRERSKELIKKIKNMKQELDDYTNGGWMKIEQGDEGNSS